MAPHKYRVAAHEVGTYKTDCGCKCHHSDQIKEPLRPPRRCILTIDLLHMRILSQSGMNNRNYLSARIRQPIAPAKAPTANTPTNTLARRASRSTARTCVCISPR